MDVIGCCVVGWYWLGNVEENNVLLSQTTLSTLLNPFTPNLTPELSVCPYKSLT